MSPSKKVKPAKKGSQVGKAKESRVVIKAAKNKEKPAPAARPADVSTTKPENKVVTTILRILAVAAVVGITLYVYSIREQVEAFAEYGYLGAFIIMVLANATVVLPAPGVAVIFAMGAILNPWGVALAAGAGGTIGELTGYLAGYSGQAAVENTQLYNRILPWVQKYGAWVILVLSAIPNPFFDIAGIAAGIAKIPIWKFMLACWVGQTIKMTMFAFAGAYSIDWVASFYK